MAKRAGAGSHAAARAGDPVGYARVSTRDQTVALQLDALKTAGCARMFEETASGAQRDRPQLAAALDYMRAGDTLVVWKLDRLARSTKQLIETVEGLARHDIGFRCLTQDIERTCAGLDAARARGRRGGRPPSLKPRDLKEARALLSDPDITVEEVAARLKVSPSTLYRHLPGGRSAVTGTGTVADPA